MRQTDRGFALRPRGEDDEAGANRQTASLAALAVILLIVVASLALIQQLRYNSTVEDCLLSGRTNCGTSVTVTTLQP